MALPRRTLPSLSLPLFLVWPESRGMAWATKGHEFSAQDACRHATAFLCQKAHGLPSDSLQTSLTLRYSPFPLCHSAPQQHGWHLGLGHPGPRNSVSAFCPLAQSQLESRQTRGHSLPSPLPVSLAMTSSPRSWTTPHLSRERVCVLGGRVAENHCGPTGQWHPPGLSVVVMAPLGP